MERHKYFLGTRTDIPYQFDGIMGALERNIQKFNAFITSHYGINMLYNRDAMKILASSGIYTFKSGKAMSPQFNLIINPEDYDFTSDLNGTSGPYGGNPTDNAVAYIFVIPKETYDENSEIIPFDGRTITESYETWNISYELKLEESIEVTFEDYILLAKMTYDADIEEWSITEDYRGLYQFVLNLGTLSLVNHILSAHTACLYPAGTDALTPEKETDLTLKFAPTTSGDYIYCEGKIFELLENYTYDFSGENTGSWYYVYIKNKELTVISAGSNSSSPDSLVSLNFDDDKYLVLCYVWYNATQILDDPVDMRPSYFLPTDSDEVRFTPIGKISAKDLQSAIEELDSEKLSIDGSIAMDGNLNLGYKDLENVHDISLIEDPGNGIDKHIIQTSAYELNLNATAALNKGIKLAYNGDVYIQGTVKSNIDMEVPKTIDGRDVSELSVEEKFTWIVDRDGDGGPEENQDGYVGLEYALTECASTPGLSVYIMEPPTSFYTLFNNYNLEINTTIIGANMNIAFIRLNGKYLRFGDGFLIKRLRIHVDTELTGNDELVFPNNGKMEDCYINKEAGFSPVISLGQSVFSNVIADSVDSAIDAIINGSEMIGCKFGYVSIVDNAIKAVLCEFNEVDIYTDDCKFVASSAPFDGSGGQAWEIKYIAVGAPRSYQFTDFINCKGDIKNAYDFAIISRHAHCMVTCHRGNWYGAYGQTIVNHWDGGNPGGTSKSSSYYYKTATTSWEPWQDAYYV